MKDFLKKIALFSDLNDEELEFLSNFAIQKKYEKDSYIVHEDEPGISLYIIRSGSADVFLKKSDGPLIPLSTLRKYDHFGEVSLFDAKPRSATVIAREHTSIVKFSRDILISQIKIHPDIALKILGNMAHRLRHSDEIVRQFSNRIYGEVSQRIEEKIDVQLDTVKTLYKSTEDRATKTMDNVEENWKFLWRLITILVSVFTIFASVLGFLGYKKFEDLKEIDLWAKKAEKNIFRVEKYASETEILKDLMLDIQRIREETKVELLNIPNYNFKGNSLKYISININNGKKELFKNYIKKCDEKRPEVCLAAVLTCLELRNKAKINLADKEIKQVLETLIQVIKNCPDKDWGMQLRTRDEVIKLVESFKNSEKMEYNSIIRQFKSLVSDKQLEDHVKFNFSLILANFHEKDPDAVNILQWHMVFSKSPWQRNMARIALLQFNQNEKWNSMRDTINKNDSESFIAALLLAQLGKKELSRIGIENLINGNKTDPINLIIERINGGIEKHYSNIYMGEYCEYLINNLQ